VDVKRDGLTANRTLLAALAVSAVIHIVFLAVFGRFTVSPPAREPDVQVVQLVEPPPPEPEPEPQPGPELEPQSEPDPQPEPEPEPEPEPQPEPELEPQPEPEREPPLARRQSPGRHEEPRRGRPEGKEEAERPEPGPAVEPLPEVDVGTGGLLDREVIGEIARLKTPEDDTGVTFETEEYQYKDYMKRLKAAIEGVWEYPREAWEKGIYGDLYIEFIIEKDGRLGPVRVLRISGYPILDKAALKALEDAAPFWPLPESWQQDRHVVTGHFIYTRGYRYLR
jgi:protein TonB